MRLPRLFRTNLFRLTLAYMALFALSVGALSAFIYWATLGYLDTQTNAIIEAEIRGLYEQYERSSVRGLSDVIEERVARLFGFDYRIEVYTPGDKRVHGYYTLPALHDGHLIGRVDAKAYRSERRLEIRHVHLEPWFATGAAAPVRGERVDQEAGLAGLAEAFRSLATFVGADDVDVRRVTPTRLPLSPAEIVRLLDEAGK